MPEPIKIPEALSKLHPRIKEWVKEHTRLNSERKRRIKSSDPGDGWQTAPLWNEPTGDLTERDEYRFRVTSGLISALSAKGAVVLKADIEGQILIRLQGERITIKVAEKMRKAYGLEIEPWTAFPNYHQNGLAPRGLLRFAIVAPYPPKELVEVKSADRAALQAFFDAILSKPAEIKERNRIFAERARLSRIEREEREKTRYEAERQAEIWGRFRKASDDWYEAERLRVFKNRLFNASGASARLGFSGTDAEFSAWLDDRIGAMDPFSSEN